MTNFNKVKILWKLLAKKLKKPSFSTIKSISLDMI